jgi:YVTN family beta-propeller protein
MTGTAPDDIAITPDGTTAYVANRGNLYATWFRTAANSASKNIGITTYAARIAITPDGTMAYVTAALSRQYRMNKVTPIRTSTNTALTLITAGRGPGTAIAINPDGATAYVANYASGTVTPIRTATNTALAAITVGRRPVAIAITP